MNVFVVLITTLLINLTQAGKIQYSGNNHNILKLYECDANCGSKLDLYINDGDASEPYQFIILFKSNKDGSINSTTEDFIDCMHECMGIDNGSTEVFFQSDYYYLEDNDSDTAETVAEFLGVTDFNTRSKTKNTDVLNDLHMRRVNDGPPDIRSRTYTIVSFFLWTFFKKFCGSKKHTGTESVENEQMTISGHPYWIWNWIKL